MTKPIMRWNWTAGETVFEIRQWGAAYEVSIDGEWWHKPGSCRYCRPATIPKPAALPAPAPKAASAEVEEAWEIVEGQMSDYRDLRYGYLDTTRVEHIDAALATLRRHVGGKG